MPQPLLLLESLAELGDSVSERVQAALSEPFDVQDREQANWQICLVLLAGELRRPELVPPLVERLSVDAEWLNEECMFALARIGSDDVVSLIEERLLDGSEQFQFYAAGVLERIHSERSVEASIALTAALGEEDSHDVRLSLAQALLGSFASEGIEPARQLVLAGPMDESLLELRSTLLTVSKALEIDFPERSAWEQEQRDDEAYRQQFQTPAVEYVDASGGFVESKPLAPVRRASATPARFRLPPRVRLPANSATNPYRVGRNDACPCGSGKKYKKCCLPKQRAGRR